MTGLDEKPEIVRRIPPETDHRQLALDLEELKNRAVAMGAAEAAVIRDKDIVFNPELRRRVNADNAFASVHWPLVYPEDDIEEAVRAYQRAIFFRVNIDLDGVDYGGGPIPNENHRRRYLKIYEITTAIESDGFYLGYHLAMGLAAGNCRSIFCPDEKRCRPMIRGKACLHPNKGRPAMAAAGIDAAAIAKNLKWTVEAGAGLSIPAGLVLID